jgi:hypothetical protein
MSTPPERKLTIYRGVRRRREVEYVAQALEHAGCTIRVYPDATKAPFVFSIDLPTGEPLDLVCYIFSANQYGQRNRPDDEHRLQVKYGSRFKEFHYLYLPQHPDEVTLFFGIHFDEGVLVAVDPAMHNPTWFSRSIEFKTHHVEKIQQTRWCGWERERTMARRKDKPPLENHQTEVLLGFLPDRILDYIHLEKATTGLSPGERLLMIERGTYPAITEGHSFVAEPGAAGHSLTTELGLPIEDILDMIDSASRLKVAVRGRAAEKHLLRVLSAESALESVQEIDEDGQPDFVVGYRGKSIRIECKNTLRKLTRGHPKVDFQKTRASKSDPCSRYYRPEQFEVLAACLHPVTESWEFRFCPTRSLPPHTKCVGHLSQNVLVENGDWAESVVPILDAIAGP